MICESSINSLPFMTIAYLRVLTIIIITNCIVISNQETYNYKLMEVVDDLPVEEDLDRYISTLQKIVKFVEGHKYYVDIDLCLGLYLMNGYLKNMLNLKADFLSCDKFDQIIQLVKMNDKIINIFVNQSKRQNNEHKVPDILVHMLNIQDNEVTWPYYTQKLTTELLNKTKFYSRKKLEQLYLKWPKYKKTVYDYKTGYSTLGTCLNLLAQNPINTLTEFVYCQVPYTCLEYVLNGVDYGYEIAHRLLILLAARYWRNCNITADDKDLIDKFCATMYNELEYNAYHNFELPDLFLDHVSLCSFEGHAQFLRRSWIDELLDFQTRFGCFNLTRHNVGSALLVAIFQNISEKGDLMVWGESCNAHTTGAAGVVLAAAIGFIMEITVTKEIRCDDDITNDH